MTKKFAQSFSLPIVAMVRTEMSEKKVLDDMPRYRYLP